MYEYMYMYVMHGHTIMYLVACMLFGAQRREDKQASAECNNASAMSSTSAVPAHSLPTPAKGKDDDCYAIMHAYMHTLQSYSLTIRLSICATPDFAPMIFRPLAALVASCPFRLDLVVNTMSKMACR